MVDLTQGSAAANVPASAGAADAASPDGGYQRNIAEDPDKGGRQCFWKATGLVQHHVAMTVLNVYSWSGAPVSVNESASGTSTAGIALEGKDDDFTADGTETIKDTNAYGVGAKPGYVNNAIENTYNFAHYKFYCTAALVKETPYKWMVDSTADFQSPAAPTITHKNEPYCGYTHSAGQTVKTSTARAVTIKLAFTIPGIGISLSGQRGYGNSEIESFTVNKASNFCASNPNGPASSGSISAKQE